MAPVTLYHNPRCSKSRAALTLLREKGVEVEIVRYLDAPPRPSELSAILKKLGMTPLQITRVKEPLFKELGLSRGDHRSTSEWVRILCENPKLIERPIAVAGARAVLARPAEKLLELL